MNNIQRIQENIDKCNEFFLLLNQLTTAPQIDKNTFKKIVSSLNDNHNIFVYIKDNKLIGTISLLIEQKLIHNGKCVAHIEDLVVDKDYNCLGIAKELLAHTINVSKNQNCYKIILNCKKELIPFYEKSNFREKDLQMVLYIDDD